VEQLIHSEVTNSSHGLHIAVVCDNLRLPGNIGMVFRVAEAMGVSEVHLCGQENLIGSARVRKASRAAIESLAAYRHSCAVNCIEQLVSRGFRIIAAEITSRSEDLRQYNFKAAGPKIALVVGAESLGVSQAVLSKADSCISIPMYGANSSMNVACALSIVLYECIRQS
jgi:tRNA G18 (ribose-2'-O)-methylase SpoU